MSVGAMLSSPVVVNDVVYVGSTDGFLYALI
jgi:outer membrane protein assembly factor BamB